MFAALSCRVRERNQSIFCAIENAQSIKTKKDLVKDGSAARIVLVRTITTYVNSACVSSVAGGIILVMTSIMPNYSQFSNCTVDFKRFIEFSFRISGKLRWPDFVISHKFHLMVYLP